MLCYMLPIQLASMFSIKFNVESSDRMDLSEGHRGAYNYLEVIEQCNFVKYINH